MEKLNILDEQGNIIGEEYRDVIHQKGLLHGEIHVWCLTPDNKLIFQHRAKDKDTYPNLLDATAGGHVDLGETYDESAIKELREETGINAVIDDLVFLRTEIKNNHDEGTGMTNYARRNIYLYKPKVTIDNLTIESGKAIGFVSFPLAKLFELSEQEASRFIPTLLDESGLSLFKDIEKINI